MIDSLLIRISLISSSKTHAHQPTSLSKSFYWDPNTAFSEWTDYNSSEDSSSTENWNSAVIIRMLLSMVDAGLSFTTQNVTNNLTKKNKNSPSLPARCTPDQAFQALIRMKMTWRERGGKKCENKAGVKLHNTVGATLLYSRICLCVCWSSFIHTVSEFILSWIIMFSATFWALSLLYFPTTFLFLLSNVLHQQFCTVWP